MGLFPKSGKVDSRPATRAYLPRLLVTSKVYTRVEKKFLFVKREEYKEEELLVPIDASDIFMTGDEAKNFFPIFLKQSVDAGLLDKTKLFTDEKEVDESYCKMVVVPLKVSQLEVADDNEPDFE
jgi:hypothetical protein